MIRSIKERIKAPESKFGKILKNYVSKVLALITAVGALSEYTGILSGLGIDLAVVPIWLKATIAGCSALSFVIAKLTVGSKTEVAIETTPSGAEVVTVTPDPDKTVITNEAIPKVDSTSSDSVSGDKPTN